MQANEAAKTFLSEANKLEFYCMWPASKYQLATTNKSLSIKITSYQN